jgi:HNH endonuclease
MTKRKTYDALTVEMAKELFYFDPTIKTLRWRVTVSNGKIKAGSIAGRIQDGYWCVGIGKKRNIKVHRVVWLLYYGCWPSNDIDHINLDKSDNRIENLRDVTMSQNLMNRAKQKNNTSGFKGIHWCSDRQRWRAHIGFEKKKINLGYYKNIEDAVKVRIDKEMQLFKEFGRPQ